jgi:transposase
MLVPELLPSARALELTGLKIASGLITIEVASIQASGACPACGEVSSRVHSRYMRKLIDLPWHGKQVQIRWRSRRLFCDVATCPRRIFTERVPDVAAPHARATSRMTQALRAIGIACGGEGGARLGKRLGMLASPDRVLRVIRRTPLEPQSTPRVLGVDDFAFRRGHRYGTILCDLEQHRAVDLLPERSSESFRDWLQSHPGIEVISRDRGDYYIKGAEEGAPTAAQVADRWHLLKNLREALTKATDRCSPQIVAAARALWREQQDIQTTTTAGAEPVENPAKNGHVQQLKQARRARRLQRYEQVLELHRQKLSNREIARRLGMYRDTVRRYLQAGTFPERAARRYPGSTIPFGQYLQRRWHEGCRNAAQLTRELQQEGFKGSYYMVKRFVAHWRQPEPNGGQNVGQLPSARSLFQRPSSNRIAWLLMYPPSDPDNKNQMLLERIRADCPTLAAAADLATQFVSLLKERNASALDVWVDRARSESSAPDLRRFAEGLKADWAAVKAAFSLPWSNGQTEGHVNRLKLIKRQMFGRAKFDLLRLRFLNAG